MTAAETGTTAVAAAEIGPALLLPSWPAWPPLLLVLALLLIQRSALTFVAGR
jgi:hypothetical protein